MPTIPEISPARRWTIAGLLFTSGLINYLDRAIVSVALPLIALDLHLGPAIKGVLLSAFFWSYAAMQLPMGWLADRVHLRWFYTGAFVLWSVACGLTGFATTLGALIALRIVLGIGESIYVPGGMKIVNVMFEPKDHGLATGIMNCGTRAGLAIGTPIIAALVVRFGWHNAFFILGFSSLLWLIPWLLVFPGKAGTPAPRKAEEPAAAAGAKGPWWRIDRNLLLLFTAHMGYGYYWYLLVTWLPDYLVESRHMPLQKAGAYAVLPYLVYAIGEPLGGWLADRLIRLGWSESRARKTIITVSFLTSFMLIPAGLVADDFAAELLLGGAALVGFSTGNILALLQLAAPPSSVGIWAGTQNFGGNISGVVAPVVTGLLIARTGSYFPGFVVAVVLLVVCIPFYWMVGVARRPAREEAECRTA